MRKMLVSIFILLAFPTICNSWLGSISMEGSGTIAYYSKPSNINITDGTAFIDTLGCCNLQAYVGKKITIVDSAGKAATGIIGAQGSSSISNLVTTWSNRTSYEYETLTTTDNSISSAINTSGWGIASTGPVNITSGTVYRLSATMTLNSGTGPRFTLQNKNYTGNISTASGQYGTGAINLYITATGSDAEGLLVLYNNTGEESNFSLSNASIIQVSAPSTSGNWISLPGTTKNWLSKDVGFNISSPAFSIIINDI